MRYFCLLAVFLMLGVPSGRADISGKFTAGLAAYDGGDYAAAYAAYAAWEPLARNGEAEAQIAVAGMYMQGLGVQQNSGTAVMWYCRAARQGAVIAQLNLGDLYARGLGVQRDLVRSYAWLHLAAQSGQVWARWRLAKIGGQMPKARIADALRLAPRLISTPLVVHLASLDRANSNAAITLCIQGR
jgi:TPR repeat protein